MNKKIFFAVLISSVVVVGIGIIFNRTSADKGHIPIAKTRIIMSYTHVHDVNQNIHFEIATTTTELERGLSGRVTIPNNYAMLFVFKRSDIYGFWMKNMLAPIDIVWLSDNGTIVGIEGSVQPDTYPHVFYPPVPVRYVLEVRSGFSATRGWHTGSVIVLPAPYEKNHSK